MKINKEIIEKMGPCKDRFNNFIYHYEHRNFEVHEFINLENITYNDKIWVMTRILTKNQLVNWSIMCAESVKIYFDKKYPNNKCLNELFAYLHTINDFEALTSEQKEKILKLRKDAAYAAYAADAAAAAYAADAAAYAAYAREEQRNLNLLYLASVLE